MSSNLKLDTATRNALGDALITRIGSGALLKVYTGTQPANSGVAVSTQTLLGTLTCGSPFAPSTSGGVITANTITGDSSADATGTAAWFRLVGSSTTMDGTVGTSGCDLNLNSVSITANGTIDVTSLTLTMPGG